MKRFKCRILSVFSLLVVVAVFPISAATINAATIFESGTLGPTGIPQGSVDASNISANVFAGVRFQLTQSVSVTQIGGHFVGRNNDTFFGAILALDNENDFPDSGDLSTPDVLGSTELTFPVSSAEVFGDLSLSLDPGWYALVFGSGLFGTNGDGAAPLNNPDIGEPSYIAHVSSRWKDSAPTDGIEFNDYRFVLLGNVIPEPASLGLVLIGTLCFVRQRLHFTVR